VHIILYLGTLPQKARPYGVEHGMRKMKRSEGYAIDIDMPIAFDWSKFLLPAIMRNRPVLFG